MKLREICEIVSITISIVVGSQPSQSFGNLERRVLLLLGGHFHVVLCMCAKGAILGLSHANQVRVKSVPDGPKARKGERQQKAEEIQQGICCAN